MSSNPVPQWRIEMSTHNLIELDFAIVSYSIYDKIK